MKVRNMTNAAGNKTANQYIVETDEGTYFQSYDTIIIFEPRSGGGKTQLDVHKWDCTATTGKYRNLFLGEHIAETRRKIKAGIYELVDLNK